MKRIGKLFRLSGVGYETLILSDTSEDDRLITHFANSIKGSLLAKALGKALDEAWYEQNKKDIECLKDIKDIEELTK